MSPEDVEQREAYARMLQKQYGGVEPLGHWTQVLAKVLGSATAAYHYNRARAGEREGRAAADAAFKDALRDSLTAPDTPGGSSAGMTTAKDKRVPGDVGTAMEEQSGGDRQGFIGDRDATKALGDPPPLSEYTAWDNAIGAIETGDQRTPGTRNYTARGPVVKKGQYAGQRAAGYSQIMPGNLPEWSQQALGKEITLAQLLDPKTGPALQEAITKNRFDRGKAKGYSPEQIASVWFTGSPNPKGSASDGYTTAPEYLRKFRNLWRDPAHVDMASVEVNRGGPVPAVGWNADFAGGPASIGNFPAVALTDPVQPAMPGPDWQDPAPDALPRAPRPQPQLDDFADYGDTQALGLTDPVTPLPDRRSPVGPAEPLAEITSTSDVGAGGYDPFSAGGMGVDYSQMPEPTEAMEAAPSVIRADGSVDDDVLEREYGALLRVLNNPWLKPQQATILGKVLQDKIKRNQPLTRKERLELMELEQSLQTGQLEQQKLKRELDTPERIERGDGSIWERKDGQWTEVQPSVTKTPEAWDLYQRDIKERERRLWSLYGPAGATPDRDQLREGLQALPNFDQWRETAPTQTTSERDFQADIQRLRDAGVPEDQIPKTIAQWKRMQREGMTFTHTNPDGSTTTMRIGGGGQTGDGPIADQTKGQTALDKKFAEDYAADIAGGGIADALKNMQQLEDQIAALETAIEEGENMSGAVSNLVPEGARRIWAQVRGSTDPIEVRDQVAEIVQRNLRAVLGGQFAQKEGEALINRAYDLGAEESANLKRLNRLFAQIKLAMAMKVEALQYWNEHGTLSGFEGRIPTMDMFRQAVAEEEGPQWKVGQRIINHETGDRMEWDGTKWVPLNVK
jgi:hypothetical protein